VCGWNERSWVLIELPVTQIENLQLCLSLARQMISHTVLFFVQTLYK
jgi:hypothetical protein